jgi:polysaccharide biosynthesis PFTS motif protein
MNQSDLEQFHSELTKSDFLNTLRATRKKIVNYEVDLTKKTISQTLNQIEDEFFLLINAQNLCRRTLSNQNLTKKILKSQGLLNKIRFPLPLPWQKVMQENQFKLSPVICDILWKFYLLKAFISNYWDFTKFSGQSLKQLKENNETTTKNSSTSNLYFHNYKEGYNDRGTFNFIEWCKNNPELQHHLFVHSDANHKDSKGVLYNNKLLQARNVKDLALNLIKTLNYQFIMTKKYGLKRTVFVPMREIFILFNLSNKPTANLQSYLFLDGSRLRKPLWACYLEKINSRVIFIETSQSIEPLDLFGNEPVDDFQSLDNWKEIWTVSEDRRDYLTTIFKSNGSKVKNLGLPWLFDSDFKIKHTKKKIISIFDVEPHLDYFGWSTYNIYGLQRIEFAITFLEDVISMARDLDLLVLHKPKRNIMEKRYPRYSELISNYQNLFPKTYSLVEPISAPHKIIGLSNFVIATPFTSALISNPNAKCARAYYDPLSTGIESKRKLGIDLLVGRTNLRKWVETEINAGWKKHE